MFLAKMWPMPSVCPIASNASNPVGAYLIAYRAIRRPVEIVAVAQGARDIPSFLHRRLSR